MPGTASGIGNFVGAAVSVLVAAVDIVDPVTAKVPASWIVAAPRAPMQTTALTPDGARLELIADPLGEMYRAKVL